MWTYTALSNLLILTAGPYTALSNLLILTLVFADNGGYLPGSSNYPLREGKQALYEGGVRGAAFITGPLIEVRLYEGAPGCFEHSANLSGENASVCCLNYQYFISVALVANFDCIQQFYAFISVPSRCAKLLQNMKDEKRNNTPPELDREC